MEERFDRGEGEDRFEEGRVDGDGIDYFDGDGSESRRSELGEIQLNRKKKVRRDESQLRRKEKKKAGTSSSPI